MQYSTRAQHIASQNRKLKMKKKTNGKQMSNKHKKSTQKNHSVYEGNKV